MTAPKPRKRAAKKKADPVVEVEAAKEVLSNDGWDCWPKEVMEKHRRRQEEARQHMAFLVEQKKQRLDVNGVPPEKHSL